MIVHKIVYIIINIFTHIFILNVINMNILPIKGE
jgi:3-isopropylmalate dehydratase small subunit